MNRGVHPCYESLSQRFPVEDKRVFLRLQNACSLLAHWSPIFGEVRGLVVSLLLTLLLILLLTFDLSLQRSAPPQSSHSPLSSFVLSRLIPSSSLHLHPHSSFFLTHTSPQLLIAAQVPYVPQLMFPFVLLFGADELAALETVMTLLLWWGHSFHATFPHPPVHIVGKEFACRIL